MHCAQTQQPTPLIVATAIVAVPYRVGAVSAAAALCCRAQARTYRYAEGEAASLRAKRASSLTLTQWGWWGKGAVIDVLPS